MRFNAVIFAEPFCGARSIEIAQGNVLDSVDGVSARLAAEIFEFLRKRD